MSAMPKLQNNLYKRANVGLLPAVDARFQHICIYVFGLLPKSHSCSHPMTVIDHFTKLPVAVLIQNITAVTDA